MARFTPARTIAAKDRSRRASTRKRSVGRKLKPHKIVFESITQEKKRLCTVITFQAQPPPGFTFVPAGNPALTEKCKEYSRSAGHKVFVVSTAKHKTDDISQHVHRIGYHFVTSIVTRVCRFLDLTLDRNGHISQRRAARTSNQAQRNLSPASITSQRKLNADARDAITDLFPNMPERDKSDVISHAFRKGRQKIGTAEDVALPLRVHLAVLAHIRHTYTNYDELLKQGSAKAREPGKKREKRDMQLRVDARKSVRDACYRKLMDWRGDEENGEDSRTKMEEIFREIIVISDSEDSEGSDAADLDDGVSESDFTDDEGPLSRGTSVQFVSTNPVMQELKMSDHDPKHRGGPYDEVLDEDQPYIQDLSAEGGRRYALPTATYEYRRRQKRIDRRGFHRYEAVAQDPAAEKVPPRRSEERQGEPASYVTRHSPRTATEQASAAYYVRSPMIVDKPARALPPLAGPNRMAQVASDDEPLLGRLQSLDDSNARRPVPSRAIRPRASPRGPNDVLPSIETSMQIDEQISHYDARPSRYNLAYKQAASPRSRHSMGPPGASDMVLVYPQSSRAPNDGPDAKRRKLPNFAGSERTNNRYTTEIMDTTERPKARKTSLVVPFVDYPPQPRSPFVPVTGSAPIARYSERARTGVEVINRQDYIMEPAYTPAGNELRRDENGRLISVMSGRQGQSNSLRPLSHRSGPMLHDSLGVEQPLPRKAEPQGRFYIEGSNHNPRDSWHESRPLITNGWESQHQPVTLEPIPKQAMARRGGIPSPTSPHFIQSPNVEMQRSRVYDHADFGHVPPAMRQGQDDRHDRRDRDVYYRAEIPRQHPRHAVTVSNRTLAQHDMMEYQDTPRYPGLLRR
ncbi:MAG: hypothetical protein M1825_005032 [Sarcosagium campestre]|nr:MAG: hypothetical protein M1825_005032 [Sarcosagium campestre]